MDDPHRYLDPLTLAKVRSLELQARLIVEGYLSGMHKSPYHGFSVEFAQHREYVPGDDIRHVDWKVFGRTERYFLKQYEEETNLVCWLVLHVLDAAEMDFPFQEATLFRGLEQHPELLTDPRSLRRGYLDELESFLTQVRRGCREQNIDYVPLRTDANLGVALSSYLAHRL